MNKPAYLTKKLGIVLCTALLGYAAQGQPSVSVAVSAPLVEIRAESDFYEPLAPEGEWVVVGSYGRCWRPSHVQSDWRPYCDGSWERTDAGWYWVSDEPWAWATYHYGRWDYADQYGWYWVPQIQWAPAWVSWHEGGGYIGWAPLQPSVSISAHGYVGFNQSRISPRAFVFVKQGQFQDRIRPSVVVVNDTTIINKTKTITNTKIVNKVVINEGPATSEIAKASGRPVPTVAVQELRHKQEAAVVARQPARPVASEKTPKPATPVTSEGAQAHEKKIVPVTARPEVQKPDATPRTPTSLAPANRVNEGEKAKSVPAHAEPVPEKQRPAPPEIKPVVKPEIKPEATRPAATREPGGQNLIPQPARPERPAPQENKAQQPAREKPALHENNGANQPEKERQNEPKQP